MYGESSRAESAGNQTIKPGQAEPYRKVSPRPSEGEPAVHVHVNSRTGLNQTNISSYDLSNVNEMSLTSLQKLSKFFKRSKNYKYRKEFFLKFFKNLIHFLLVETLNYEKNQAESMKEENQHLKSLIEDLKNEMLVSVMMPFLLANNSYHIFVYKQENFKIEISYFSNT